MSTPTAFVGIDIGADALHMALSHDKAALVQVIDLTDPHWFEVLRSQVPPGARVCLEPTGWHYSAPVIHDDEPTCPHCGQQLVFLNENLSANVYWCNTCQLEISI